MDLSAPPAIACTVVAHIKHVRNSFLNVVRDESSHLRTHRVTANCTVEGVWLCARSANDVDSMAVPDQVSLTGQADSALVLSAFSCKTQLKLNR